MNKQTEKALRSFLRGLVKDGINADKCTSHADLVSWAQANGEAARSILCAWKPKAEA